MTSAPDLLLRDIHEPAAPAWWPPAPGWWIVAAAVLGVLGWMYWRRWHRRRHARRVARLFDDAIASATTPAAQVAAMSGLLRRAARRRDPAADTLAGEDWLRFLDQGLPRPVFVEGEGRVLLDGAFRRDAGAVDLDAVRSAARARFLDWMVSP